MSTSTALNLSLASLPLIHLPLCCICCVHTGLLLKNLSQDLHMLAMF